MSGNDVKVKIDQMTTLLFDLCGAESEVQLLNYLKELDKLDVTNMTYCVLEATGAGKKVEKIQKKKGKTGELATGLVDKWKRNVEEERNAIKNKLPPELRQSEVEIYTKVTAFKFGALGYETLGKVELAIIHEKESNCYQLLLYRGKQSPIIVANISPRFMFLVHQDFAVGFTDDEEINWRICFDSQDDQTEAARKLLLCKAMFGKEDVVSTDLVIGRGRGAEEGDILEIHMAVWEVTDPKLTNMIENTRWKKKTFKLKVGGINRFRDMTRHIVGVKKGGRRFMIASSNNCKTAFDIEVEQIKVATTTTVSTAEDATDEHATAAGKNDGAQTAEDAADEHAQTVQDDPGAVEGEDMMRPEPTVKKKRKTDREAKKEKVSAMNTTIQEALAALKGGLFTSRRQCAEAFGLSEATLRKASKTENYVFKGAGQKFEVMTEEEEKKIKEHCVERLKLGVGLALTSTRCKISSRSC